MEQKEIENIILQEFPECSLREMLVEVFQIIWQLSEREPVYGFAPKFYVPGWIGIIQNFYVSLKISRYNKEQFSCGKGYLDFAGYIVELSDRAAKLYGETEWKDSVYKDRCGRVVVGVFDMLVVVWKECCPEVANFIEWPSKVSAYIWVKLKFESSLEDCGYPKLNVDSEDSLSFSDDFKIRAYHFVGYILNVILFGIIIAIFSAIF